MVFILRFHRIACFFTAFFLLAVMFPAQAAGPVLVLSQEEAALRYTFDSSEVFVLLTYTAPKESGQEVLYSENGHFEGLIDLPYSRAGGKTTVTVESLRGKKLAQQRITLAKASGYTAPKGTASAKVTGLTLEETTEGVRYTFSAPGADYLVLKFRNKQQTGEFFVFPDENGHFSGELVLPLTYARTLNTVQILSGKGKLLAEAQARKAYLAPEAPEQQSGRLSGVTVCIDPGHQENGQRVTEPKGPGIAGKTSGTSGSAQGIKTLRRESIVVLEISMALRDELLRQGATVVMTRETQDVFHTNIERCQIAEDGGADIMLRIHADARENHTKEGISVYAPLHSDYARAVAAPAEYRIMGELMLDAMKRSLGVALEDKTGLVHLNDDYVGNNWAKMICFLIETGYLSTPSQDYQLSSPVFQQWLAEGMAQGVYEIAVYRGLIPAEDAGQ